MKARPTKNKAKKLHQHTPEMERALREHNEGWAKMMERECAKHAEERRADFKQPYRMNTKALYNHYSFDGREKKKLIRLWVSRGLNIPEMMKLYGFIK